MQINRILISGYKIFSFLDFSITNESTILVGDNNQGKSTIFEAIELAMTGSINHHLVTPYSLTESLFNKSLIDSFIDGVKKGVVPTLPLIEVDVYFSDARVHPKQQGSCNFKKEPACGVKFQILFNPDFQDDYSQYLRDNKGEDKTPVFPIQFYTIRWTGFDDNPISRKTTGVNCTCVDISKNSFGSDADHQILDLLFQKTDPGLRATTTGTFRSLSKELLLSESGKALNKSLATFSPSFSKATISLGTDISSSGDWSKLLVPLFDGIPYDKIGDGEQSTSKILLASAPSTLPSLLLIEEPENHLSFSNMNALIGKISEINNQQVIISTHSSYVANKLSLKNLVFLANGKTLSLSKLPEETVHFFQKLPSYDTLRLVLCKKAILVEGPSDELIFRKLYKQKYLRDVEDDGVAILPVNGRSFKRYLDIAQQLDLNVVVITDNDENPKSVKDNYQFYQSEKIKVPVIEDEKEHTLEAVLVKENGTESILSMLPLTIEDGKIKEFSGLKATNISAEALVCYMTSPNKKTQCALAIYDSPKTLKYAKVVWDAL
jgi:putative ATP-dependent endonuclease of the OLD family